MCGGGGGGAGWGGGGAFINFAFLADSILKPLPPPFRIRATGAIPLAALDSTLKMGISGRYIQNNT